MKKVVCMVLAALMLLSLAACGSSVDSSTTTASSASTVATTSTSQATIESVTIIVTNGKGEISTQFEKATKDFMAANPNITVEAYSDAVGDSVKQFDKLTSSGKVVTVGMVEPGDALNKYKDMEADLSAEKWLNDTTYGLRNADGKVIGFPFCIEGFGLVYNQKVLDKAVGGTFDPFSINTRDKLKDLLNKIKASGVKYPLAYQTEPWSVGNHFASQFINQTDKPFDLVADMKAGKFDFATNAAWNGYYDTLDLLTSKEYNKYGERPLGKYYDESHVLVGKGECAMLFNGNWAYGSFKAVAGDTFGFIPVPVDNNPDNPMNNKLICGPTQVLILNKDATPQQQAAGKKFMDWLASDPKGLDFVVNQAQNISAFKSNTFKVTNPLGAFIADAISNGKTQSFSTNSIIGGDYMTKLGPEVQKYIAKQETRAELAKVFADYYKGLQ